MSGLDWEKGTSWLKLTMNRPAAGNSLTPELVRELHAAVDACEQDINMRVLVLRGKDGQFSNGMDLAVAGRGDVLESNEGADGYLRLLGRFTTSRLAVISQVDGVASGGGVGLVAASDYVLCSSHSRFRLPEVLWGLLPCLLAPFLIRRAGLQACKRMAMFAEHIDHEQALRCGLVDVVGDENDLERLLRRMASVASESTGGLKGYLNRIAPMEELVLNEASRTLNTLLSSPEVTERLRNFSERGRLPWETSGAASGVSFKSAGRVIGAGHALEQPKAVPIRPASHCWMFSGQGSQKRGMGIGLFDDYPSLVERADQILGYSIQELCVLDPEDYLSKTEFAQPALFVVSALSFLQRRRDHPWPDILAGHSLGEYAALFAAGVFDFETGLRLVQRRGQLMETTRSGAMLAVIGPNLAELLLLVNRLELDDVDVASYNLPNQTVVSGPLLSIERLAAVVAEQKLGQAVQMFIGGASHGRLAEQAALAFEDELGRHDLVDPAVPVMSNVTGRPYDPGTVRRLLGQQMRVPVRWLDTMLYLRSAGVNRATQVGPGHALEGLWEKFQTMKTETLRLPEILKTIS